MIEDTLPDAECRRYGRDLLLAIGHCIATTPRTAKSTGGLRVKAIQSLKANPQLDDETLLAALEARLSRESGADANNFETFGIECTKGWTFSQALEANAELASRQRMMRANAPCFLRAEAQSFQPAAAPWVAPAATNMLLSTAAPAPPRMGASVVPQQLGGAGAAAAKTCGLRAEAACFKPAGGLESLDCNSTDEGASCGRSTHGDGSESTEIAAAEDMAVHSRGFLSFAPSDYVSISRAPHGNIMAQLGIA
jgi:hypothetical protein